MRHEKPLKRVNPSGEIRWVSRWTDKHGKRRSAGTFKLKREAQEAIDAAYQGEGTARNQATLGSYAQTWLKRRPRSERTNASYEGRLRAVLDVKIDGRKLRDWPLAELRRGHAVDLLDHLLRVQGRAAYGAKGVLLVLSALYSDAMEDDFVPQEFQNPFMKVRARRNDPRVQKAQRTIQVWSWEDMHAFAAAAGPYEPMIRVLSDCGLRIGEMFPLERGDFHGETLEVRRTAWRGRVSAGTKTDHGEAQAGRETPVPPSLQALLEEMPKRIDTRLLFPDPHGKVWGDRRWYDLVWYPAQKASGLPIKPHEMRHSYISLQRAAGADPQKLAAMCGHSVATASAHYTHLTSRDFSDLKGNVPRSQTGSMQAGDGTAP
jgi:integrase